MSAVRCGLVSRSLELEANKVEVARDADIERGERSPRDAALKAGRKRTWKVPLIRRPGVEPVRRQIAIPRHRTNCTFKRCRQRLRGRTNRVPCAGASAKAIISTSPVFRLIMPSNCSAAPPITTIANRSPASWSNSPTVRSAASTSSALEKSRPVNTVLPVK